MLPVYAAVFKNIRVRLAAQLHSCGMETQIRVPVGSPVIAKVPIFVDEHNVTEGAMQLIKELRPAWDKIGRAHV